MEASQAVQILLVEDDPDNMRLMSHLLNSFGYAVRVANTVESAREAAQRHRFDILISDLGLPDGDGYQLMRSLRDEHGLVGIALTGRDEDKDQSRAAGFAEHLIKPVDFAKLKSILARVCPARVDEPRDGRSHDGQQFDGHSKDGASSR